MKAIANNLLHQTNRLYQPASQLTAKNLVNIDKNQLINNKQNNLIREDSLELGSNNKQLCHFFYKPSFIQQNQDSLNQRLYNNFSNKVDKMEYTDKGIYADPKNDIAFKKIFDQDNLKGLQDFVENVISNIKEFPFSKKIDTLDFLNKEQMPSLIKGKRSLCDLKVKDDQGNTYIIEMQKRNEEDYLQRIQYYASHAVTDQLDKGETHGNLRPIITISIMGKNCFEPDVPCISYHPYKETTTNKQLLLSQSHIFIELKKLDESSLGEKTKEWLNLFKNAPSLDKIPNVHNEYVLKAYHKLEQHNWTKEERDAYIDAKIYDDMEVGNIEKALKQGKAEGEKAKSFEIAKEMLSEGVSIDKVMKFTKLTKEEINQIKK
jgi:predicted transposase/invertase (TIGR01784 family)